MTRSLRMSLLMLLCAGAAACSARATTVAKPSPVEKEPALKADRGVNLTTHTIRIGALNAETGPAAAIGAPFAVGKRILAQQVNAGGSKILPDGWKVELVEKDDQFDPAQAKTDYDEISGNVLFIGTSFGTSTTLPLIANLERDDLVAMPASLSSKMAESEYTPPIGPANFFETQRGLDWAISDAGGASNVKAGIIFRADDYGQDGVQGLQAAADALGVKIVASEPCPATADVPATVQKLQQAGANYVFLTVLPTTTGAVLKAASTMKYAPKWIGNTPAWTDGFFAQQGVTAADFANFYLASGVPYWGEPSDGMTEFLAAWKKYGKGHNPDWYTLLSYIQGRAGLEVARRAIASGDVTRNGYMAALHTMKDWNAGGMVQKLDWSRAPYIVGTKTRVLKPDFTAKSWTVTADWATPSAYHRTPAPTTAAAATTAP